MPGDQIHSPHVGVQRDTPAHSPAETREGTIERAMREQRAAVPEPGRELDPSTRRGLNRILWRRVLRAAGVAFLLGAALGVILYYVPAGPQLTGEGIRLQRDGPLNAALFALFLGFAFLVVVGVITALLTLEREDGRIERTVEAKLNGSLKGPPGPT